MSRHGLLPIRIVEGQVLHVESMDEGLAQVVCRSRDAFLALKLTPGVVTYLPGSNPVMTAAPIPEDPCGADAEPTVETGATPEEPPAMPTPLDQPAQSLGPEAPPQDDGGFLNALRGYWVVEMRFGYDTDPESPTFGQPLVYPTQVEQIDLNMAHWPYTPGLAPTLVDKRIRGAGSENSPDERTVRMLYRGPDILGSHLTADKNATPVIGGVIGAQLRLHGGVTGSYPRPDIAFRIARYSGAGIKTVEDLQALHFAHPATLDEDNLPARIETLFGPVSWQNNGSAYTFPVDTFENFLTGYLSGDNAPLLPNAIPVNQFNGPQLLAIELVDGWSLDAETSLEVGASLFTQSNISLPNPTPPWDGAMTFRTLA